MFRDRPLTWLFVIANGCVDLVFISMANAHHESGGRDFFTYGLGLVFISLVTPLQLILVTLWVCVCKVDRLTRTAYLTVAVFAAVFAVHCLTYEPSLGLLSIVFYCYLTLTTCCAFYIANRIGMLSGGKATENEGKRKFQISLMEMMGWTTLVAIWAAGLRYALNFEDPDIFIDIDAVVIFALGIVASSLTALAIITFTVLDWQADWSARLGALFVTAMITLIITTAFLGFRLPDFWYLAGGYFAIQMYFALGHTVRKLDNARTANEPQLFNPDD